MWCTVSRNRCSSPPRRSRQARSSGGTGLGLAIAKHLVGAHGGAITARNNTDGPGAIFTFTLPVAAAHESSELPATTDPVSVTVNSTPTNRI